jgi:hypothetical protein
VNTADRHRARYERIRTRLLADIPALTGLDVAELLQAAQAHTPRALLAVDGYLSTGAGTILTVDAGCPLPVARLTHVLRDAGLPVQPPGCGRCGRRLLLRHQRAEGRVCDGCARADRRRSCARCARPDQVIVARGEEGPLCERCHRADADRFEECAGCGRRRYPFSRRPDGAALCQACHVRPSRTCIDCGTDAPAQAVTTSGPVCSRCYALRHQPKRTCGGCGQIRQIANRATATTPDLCASCAPRNPRPVSVGIQGHCVVCGRRREGHTSRADGAFYCNSCRRGPARRCAFCGHHRPIDANWPAGPACSSCVPKIKGSPAPCAGCNQTRVLIGIDRAGRGICGPCAGWDLDYLCPTCGEAGRIYEKQRCFRCTVEARLRDMLADQTGEIPQQLHPLVTAMLAADQPRSVLVWLGKSPAAQLLRDLGTRDQPLSHRLLDELPPDQHVDYLRNLLVHTEILPVRIEQIERLTPWLERHLATVPATHARLIHPFATWYLLHRARRRAERRGVFTAAAAARFRSQIRIALDLLGALDAAGIALADLHQPWLDQWLTTGPPARYVARSFIQWITERGLARDVTIPTQNPAAPSVFLEQDEQARQLERCLGDEQLPVDVRAAGALILLFGISLS